jgi:hypothetical protein
MASALGRRGKLIGALIRPSRGTLLFDGTPLLRPTRDVGIVFQDAVLLEWRTVLDNVLLPTEILGLDKAKSRNRATAVVAKVGDKGTGVGKTHDCIIGADLPDGNVDFPHPEGPTSVTNSFCLLHRGRSRRAPCRLQCAHGHHGSRISPSTVVPGARPGTCRPGSSREHTGCDESSMSQEPPAKVPPIRPASSGLAKASFMPRIVAATK